MPTIVPIPGTDVISSYLRLYLSSLLSRRNSRVALKKRSSDNFYLPDERSDEQWERMNILFEEFPELKEVFELKEEFRKLYWSKRDKEEYKDKLPNMEERNTLKEAVRENLHVWYDHVKKSKSPGMKTFMRTIKEREED